MKIDLFQRERERAENIGGLLVLRGDCQNGPTLKVWRPKATNPYIHYYYRSIENREAAIDKAVKNFEDHKKTVQENKARRTGTPEKIESVKVGDIFNFSWGYEQTNQDFYQVIEKSGSMLTLHEIKAETTKTDSGNSMACYVKPVKNAFISSAKPFKKRLQFSRDTPYISMASYGWCSLWDGNECYVSWYA